MEPHNVFSAARRTGKLPAQLCQLLPVHQEVRRDSGVFTTRESPRTELMNRAGTHVNCFGGMIILCVFIPENSKNIYAKYNI